MRYVAGEQRKHEESTKGYKRAWRIPLRETETKHRLQPVISGKIRPASRTLSLKYTSGDSGSAKLNGDEDRNVSLQTLSTANNMAFSDETKDRFNAALGVGKTIVQWGWIPMIIWVGYRNSSPQPSLIKLITPLA